MPIYEITNDAIHPIDETKFETVNIREREDLQRLLRSQIEIVSPGTLIIAEEFSDFEKSHRRIDLLGVDLDGPFTKARVSRMVRCWQ